MTLICLLMLGFLAQISVDYSRAWIVLFYITTLAALIVERYAIVRVTAMARAAGLLSAQRIFLIGTGANVGAFINRYGRDLRFAAGRNRPARAGGRSSRRRPDRDREWRAVPRPARRRPPASGNGSRRC